MSPYLRPTIESPIFLDAEGQVIDYGNRWGGSPPEDTYSVDTHPERFAPIHAIADALIAYLRDTYDVEVEEGADVAADLLLPAYHDVVRAVRVTPNDPTSAAVTFVFTAYPGIYLHAGVLNDFHYPICGCDACDSNWQAEADELERQVLAVATGHYGESVEQRRFGPWVSYTFTYPDGTNTGGGLESHLPSGLIESAGSTLAALGGHWSAWPRRTGSAEASGLSLAFPDRRGRAV